MKKQIKKKVFNIKSTLLLLLVLIVVPFLWAALYSLPSADDFSFGLGVNSNINLGNAITRTVELYYTWSGVFFTNFIAHYIAVFDRFGVLGNQIFLFFGIIIFVLSLYNIVNMIIRRIFCCTSCAIVYIVMAITLFILFDFRRMDEVFYWQLGVYNYTIPIIMAFFAISNTVEYIYSMPSKRKIICNAFILFCASGGVTQITAFICMVLLIFNIYAFLKNRKDKYMLLLFFSVSFVGGLINALAPGNFVRANIIDEQGINVMHAFSNTIIATSREIYGINTTTWFPFLLIIVFIIYIKRSSAFNVYIWNSPITLTFIYVVLSLIVVFPVVLGYSQAEMANRNYFLLDIIIILMEISIVISLANVIKQNMVLKFTNEHYIIIFIVLFMGVFIFNSSHPFVDGLWFQTTKSLLTGKVQEYSREWQGILKYIEECEQDVIELDKIKVDECMVIKNPRLSNDANHWINQAAAEYYGKTKIYFIN